MKRLFFLLVFLLALPLLAAAPKLDPLPAPVSNNAVASVKVGRQFFLFSFMGIGPKKTWDAITAAAYALDVATGKWKELRQVPGPGGRLAASAVGLRENVYLLGGYVVGRNSEEATVPNVEAYDPTKGIWFRGADMPTPVDDAVAGAYRDRFIYLVGGWSKDDTVHNVQVYDSEKNKWQQATPLPGTPVFGHSGALVGDTIVYVDGAYKNPAAGNVRYVASDECWMGKIDHHDPTRIQWTKLPNHPGSARYRIAAGGSEHERKIYFSGGTNNPYNFDGIGYDGQPSEPVPMTFAFNLRTSKWEVVNENTPEPTMDHRGCWSLPKDW